MDILLSSGFLAFARHIGFRRAILEHGITPTGFCGTSSGSVVGALWAVGMSEEKMIALLHEPRPISQLNFNWSVWKGFFHFQNFKEILSDHLPENIEDLPIPFAVGVCTMKREAKILTKGSLVKSLAASCAIPYVFKPEVIGGEAYRDGGFADRICAKAWREYRPDQKYTAHIVDRSNGVADEQGLEGVKVVRTPRSFASLFNMGDFCAQVEEAYQLTQKQLSFWERTD